MKNKLHPPHRFLSKILFVLLSLVVITIAAFSLRYFFLGAAGITYLSDNDPMLSFLSQQKFDFWQDFITSQRPLYYKNESALLTHIIGASIALILGIFQFIPSFRRNSQSIHKIIGFLYSISALVGLSFGAYISFALPMVGGLSSIIMNIIGGLLGIIFILIALICLWQKKYTVHGKWMLRSYAVLLTIVTLYFLIGFFALCRLPADTGYELAHLLCLPINLLIAEIIIYKKLSKL